MGLGPVMLDIAGTTLTPEDEARLRHPLVGGVILFTRNYVSTRQLAELNRSISSSDQELTESELRRRLHVLAPRDGVVTAVTAEVGHAVDPSRPVLSIVPPGARLQAQLFAPSKAVGFVRGGEAVMLRFDAYPYQKFGHTAGRVTEVARVALTGQDLSAQTIMAYGEARPLQIGMQLEADIMQERRKLYEWVLEPLISITGKL